MARGISRSGRTRRVPETRVDPVAGERAGGRTDERTDGLARGDRRAESSYGPPDRTLAIDGGGTRRGGEGRDAVARGRPREGPENAANQGRSVDRSLGRLARFSLGTVCRHLPLASCIRKFIVLFCCVISGRLLRAVGAPRTITTSCGVRCGRDEIKRSSRGPRRTLLRILRAPLGITPKWRPRYIKSTRGGDLPGVATRATVLSRRPR